MKSTVKIFLISVILNAHYEKVVLQESVSGLCSSRKTENSCFCTQDSDAETHKPVVIADCAGLELGYIPNIADVEKLDLSYNAISRLTSNHDLFENSTLLSLVLSHNGIHEIADDFFGLAPNLVELDLSNNELKSFDNAKIFWGLGKLKILNLRSNLLDALPDEIFSTLTNLKELDLSYNALKDTLMESIYILNLTLGIPATINSLKLDFLDIDSIPHSYFEGCTELSFLSMIGNPLKEIPALPYSVQHLDLSGTNIQILSAKHLHYHALKTLKLNRLTKLKTIEAYAFYNLQSLEVLSLEDCNNLADIHSLAFGVLVKNEEWALKSISIARSGVRTLNSTFLYLFEEMDHVDLQNNPWKCDCDLLWIQELKGSLYREQNIRCSTPYGLGGKLVTNLTSKDLPSCVPANPHVQQVVISVLASLVGILMILIIYLIYLGPYYYQNKYRGISPNSPYHNNTIVTEVRSESI